MKVYQKYKGRNHVNFKLKGSSLGKLPGRELKWFKFVRSLYLKMAVRCAANCVHRPSKLQIEGNLSE